MGAESDHLDDDPDGVAVVAEPAVPGHAAAVPAHGTVSRAAAARVAAHGRYRFIAYPAVRDRSGTADGRDAAGRDHDHVRGVIRGHDSRVQSPSIRVKLR